MRLEAGAEGDFDSDGRRDVDDVNEDAEEDFGAGAEINAAGDAGEDFGVGAGIGADGDKGGNRSFHAPVAGVGDQPRCSLSLSLIRRGLDALGTGVEDRGVDVDGNVVGAFGAGAGAGAGAGEDSGDAFRADLREGSDAASGGSCGAIGTSRNMASQSWGKILIFALLWKKRMESSLQAAGVEQPKGWTPCASIFQ